MQSKPNNAGPATGNILNAALDYLQRGWSIIPLRPERKEPLIKWERFQKEHATPDEVREWFERTPGANIGIVTGAISGIVVIDQDGDEGRAAFEAHVGPMTTLTSESGRDGGRHLIFAHPGAPTLTTAKILEGVDVRGDGGYIVAPPSVHPNGKTYRWALGSNLDQALATLPEAFRMSVLKPAKGSTRAGDATSRRVTREELDSVVFEGERDDRLMRYAGSMVAGGLRGDELLDGLRSINESKFVPPLTDAEVRRISDSAQRREDRKQNRKPKNSPRPILEDLHRIEIQEVRWTWPGYIPSGALTTVDGLPGVGKSTLTLDLATRISTGRCMPDGSTAVAGHVLLVNNEDIAAVTVKPRVIAAGGDESQITVMKEVEVGDSKRGLLLPDDMQVIREVVLAKKTKLIVIDPLMAFLAKDVNSYSDQHVRGALGPLATLASECDLAVVLVRHPTKNRDRSAIEAGGGSIGIVAAARSGFYVAENPELTGQIVMACTKSNYAAMPRSMAFHIETAPNDRPRIAWDGPSELTAQDLRPKIGQTATKPIDRAVTFLGDYLADGPQAEKDVVSAAASGGISHSTLKRAKKRVGVLTRKTDFDGGWQWSLPQAHADQSKSNESTVVSLEEHSVLYQGGSGGDTKGKKETNNPLRAPAPDGTDRGSTPEGS